LCGKGIVHEQSVPRTPQQNGKAERYNQTLNDTVRSMLFQYNLKQSLWSYAVTYSTYVRNITLTARLGCTPYQAMFGKVPDVTNLRTFGCKVYARVPDQQRSKLDPKSILGIYLGPEVKGAGCRVLVAGSKGRKSVNIYRDIVTYETLPARVDAQEAFDLTEAPTVPLPEPTPTEHTVAEPESMLHIPEQLPLPPNVILAPSGTPATRAATPSVQGPSGSRRTSVQGPPRPVGANPVPQSGIKRFQAAFQAAGQGDAKRQRVDDLVYELLSTFDVHLPVGAPYPVMTDADPVRDVPRGIKAAMRSKFAYFWAQAIVDEWMSLMENGTWELVPRTSDMCPIPCHWVFTIKTDADGKPNRFKARLVAGGNFQQEGIDFAETYAPVSKLATLRTLLGTAAARNWEVQQIDIKTAFLHGDTDTDIYMLQPPGFIDGTNMVCHLQKCLYGLKQAPRQWYLKLANLLRTLGFESVSADSSFWVSSEEFQAVVYITSVVDDMLITSADPDVTHKVVDAILAVFQGTRSGEAHYYNGIKITWQRDSSTVVLNQPAHIDTMLAKYGPLSDCMYPRQLPIKPGLRLCKGGTTADMPSPPLDVSKYPYRALVGSLNYVACVTRPDIAYTVNQLAKYANAPTEAHWQVAIDCLRYLKGTRNWGIMFGQIPEDENNDDNDEEDDDDEVGDESLKGSTKGIVYQVPACAFADANHGTAIDDKRSVTGYVLEAFGGPVSWASRTQPVASMSTTESEFRALSDCSKEVLWLRKVLRHFGVVPRPYKVYGDNEGALHAIKHRTLTKHTKHIEIHHEFLKERHRSGDLAFVKVKGIKNKADVFTKALTKEPFERFRHLIGMVDGGNVTAWRRKQKKRK
jgi:hypothetical protein